MTREVDRNEAEGENNYPTTASGPPVSAAASVGASAAQRLPQATRTLVRGSRLILYYSLTQQLIKKMCKKLPT